MTFMCRVYTVWYKSKLRMVFLLETAKIFINGRSQAVRIPKAYRFDGNEVYIKKTLEGVLLIPQDRSLWEVWEKNLMKYDEPFMPERN